VSKIDDLCEAMTGVLNEQRALQAYATDFVNAYNARDLQTMLKAFKGSLMLYHIFIKEFTGDPIVDEIAKDMDRLMHKLHTLKKENVQNRNKRR
jgi:hypothetical protein